ncbi:phage major capsid protein [Novosphingobium kaempferiae]|uniref:phage major capsid protein n=1 Tax=Novosphingobium kaempferiae TaxID=2896849 RepID=UPI001E325C66|nr:phage major capsid protein [Novosphingobium kaempferiae]
MNLAILKSEARAVAKRQSDRLQAAIDGNRDLTAEEEAEDAKDTAELARMTKQIQRAETLLASTSALGLEPPVATPTGTVPATAKPGLDNGGFSNVAEFAQAVRFANPAAGQNFKMDDRLAAPTNVVTEGGDSAGSFLVPAEFRQEIVDLVFADETDPLLTLIDPDPTASNRVVGLGDETTPWGTSGIQARWRVEAQQMTPSETGLTPRETKLNELYAFVLATEELLQDAPRIADLLTRKAAAAIRWKAADAFMWGDGIEKPLGFMASDALVSVAKEGSQTADTIVPKNVAKMYSRLINPGQGVWLANSDIMPTLMDFTSANGQLIWHSDYTEAPGGRLLGRPVYWTEHSKTVGDRGDLVFFNPKGYEAFKKQNGITFADSIHLYFDYNIRAFRWIFRIGGQPVLSAPVNPASGAATKSHFVALADRA